MNRPVLLAVSAFHPWPITNGYVLRVAHLVEALTEWWDVVLIAPPPPDPSDWPVASRLRALRTVELAHRGLHVTYDADDRMRLGRETAAAVRDFPPAACLLWAGVEFLAAENSALSSSLVDRIDSSTLHELRKARTQRGVRDRLSSLRRAAVWARNERRIVRSVPVTTVVAEPDAAVLRRLAPRSANKVVLLPNGVAREPFDLSTRDTTPTVTFTGGLNYAPNIKAAIHFAEIVWPQVVEGCPRARLVIAGRRPRPEVLKLESRPGVEVWGDVPDMKDVISRSWVSVAPMLSGSGIKNKVLEAWGVGRPAVMYRLATSGLDLAGPPAELVASDPEHMAALVLSLLLNPDELKRQALAAHEAAGSRSWTYVARRISDLLASLASNGKPGRSEHGSPDG